VASMAVARLRSPAVATAGPTALPDALPELE
jgi:hypothetical protein